MKGYIYLIESGGFVKIGRTNNPKNRIKNYVTENPNPQKILLVFPVSNPEVVEREVHKGFTEDRHRGEWFVPPNGDVEDMTLLVRDYLQTYYAPV